MAPLNRETNIEVLREYSVLATAETVRLKSLVEKLQALLVENRQTWLQDPASNTDLSDQLSRLQRKFYGFGRESLSPTDDRPIGHQGQQLKLHGERPHEKADAAGEAASAEEKTVDPASAPKVIEYPMSDATLKDETNLREPESSAGTSAWSEMKGFSEDSVEITVTEVTYTKVIHRRKKYRMKDEYNTSGKEVIVTAPGPVKLKPGCQYSLDFALAVVSDKYEYHLPLERQRRKMEAAGLDVDVKTLYTLCSSTAEQMEAVVARIKREILNDFCAVHIDESPWLIISDKHKGQMWTMSNRVGSYYQFEPTRAGAIAEEMLKGFEGAVITDALAAYNRLKVITGIRKGLCWAHVRREFYERMDDFPAAEQMVRMIDLLFAIEAKAESFDHLRMLRKTESREVIKVMEAWLMEQSQLYLKGDGIKKAINYAANHWTDLTTFLKDLSLPLSNNDAERALRHVVLGRKNFAGSKTINGADVAATLYTIIESAKKAGLQPKAYMKYVIEEQWHNRIPKTPSEMALEKFGKNKRVTFPEKSDWAI